MAEYLITYAELQSVANAIREAAGADPLTNTGGDYLVNDTDLISLASAIRTAAGIEADLEWPTDFITQIESLSGMTIPAGTTTLAFPQDYINIIETASSSYNINITLYCIQNSECEDLYGSDVATLQSDLGEPISSLVTTYEDDPYYGTVFSESNSFSCGSNDTIDLTSLIESLSSNLDPNSTGYIFDSTQLDINCDDDGADVNIDFNPETYELTLEGITKDCNIEILFTDKYCEIEIYAVYIPSIDQLQAAQQSSIITQQSVETLASFYYSQEIGNGLTKTPSSSYAETFIPFIKSQIIDSQEINNCIFEVSASYPINEIGTALTDIPVIIRNQFYSKNYPSATANNIADNIILINVDPGSYNISDTTSQILYQDTPIKSALGVLRNNLDSADFTLNNPTDNLSLEIRLIENSQINDLI